KTETDKEIASINSSKDSITFKETPQKLKTLVDKIAKINEVQEEHVGFGRSESENFKNFKQLKEIATIDELVLLTDNKNATVACYASWALADNAYSDLKNIFQKF